MESHKTPWFQTTNQLRIWIRMDGFLLTFTKQFCSSEKHRTKPSDFLTSSSVAARRIAALAVDVAKAAARPTILRQGTLPHIPDPHLALSQDREDKRYILIYINI